MQDRRQFLGNATVAAVGAVRARSLLAVEAPRRVFVASFTHETNTFHPVRSTSFNFSDSDPYWPTWEKSEAVLLPAGTARPLDGGSVEKSACRDVMNRVLSSLRKALPIDAVFLRLHGAMYAEGIGPAESVLTGEVRSIVGPKIPIACTFDLHGNIPARLAQFGDILVGLKTAPHIDRPEIAALAGRILLDTAKGRVRPVSYVLPIPMILQGEKAMTTSEPLKTIIEEARRIEREGIPGHRAKILAATLFVGCAWTDSQDTGMSAVVTADGSRAAARAAAVHLAHKVWDARHQFSYGCETAELEDGITKALNARERCVFLTDSGDNVTASAPGDLPIVLRQLMERKVKSAIVAGINDKANTIRCFDAGVGKKLNLSIGACVEKRFGPPLNAEVEVVRLVNEAYPGHDGVRYRLAIVRIGEVNAILAEGPTAFVDARQFEACGIDPLSFKIVAVKEGYLFAGLTSIAPRYIMLLTPGSSDMRIERLTYVRRRKPIFPFEPDTSFNPDDSA